MSNFLSCRRGSVHVARTDGRRGRRLNAGRTKRCQRGVVKPLVVGVTTTNFGDESKGKCETVKRVIFCLGHHLVFCTFFLYVLFLGWSCFGMWLCFVLCLLCTASTLPCWGSTIDSAQARMESYKSIILILSQRFYLKGGSQKELSFPHKE